MSEWHLPRPVANADRRRLHVSPALSCTCLQCFLRLIENFTCRTKTMVAQLVEIFKPRIKAKSEEAKRLLRIRELKNAMGQITAQAATLTMDAETKEMIGLDKDSIAHHQAQEKKRKEIEMRYAAAVVDDSHSAVERESFLMSYDSTFDDFNEMAIQFGYCTCGTF